MAKIAIGRFDNFGICKATNEKLVAKYLIIEVGRKTASTGKVVWYGQAKLTEAGEQELKRRSL